MGDGEESSSPAANGNGVSSSSDQKKEEEVKTVSYRKLFSFADSQDWLLMVLGTLGAVVNGLSLPLMTLLFGRLTDSFGGSAEVDVLKEVSKVSLQFVYLAIGAGVACFLQVACWMVTGERQAARIRNLYLKTILRQEIGFFDKETNTGEVVGRMSGDTVLIQDAMGEKVGKFIQLVGTFVGGFAVAFSQGWLLTLVMMCSIPPLLAAGSAMALSIVKLSSRGQVAYAESSVIVEQTIGAIRTVASFTGEKLALEKYDKSLKTSYQTTCQEGLAVGAGLGTVFAIMLFGYGLGIWYGGKLILDNSYTGGKVLTVIFAVLTSSFSLGQASPCITAFAAGKAAGYKMFETIERKPEIDAYDLSGKILDDVRGEIELRDVHFSYPTRPDEPIFTGFSLFIPSGTTVALVGQSGSGKSTVVSLIERFYDPQSGAVLIDGIDLRDLQLRWIRGKIGLVGQEPALFAASIKDNIAYGKEDATVEEIRAAAELANAAKFIDKMPKGLDTMVGEHGTQLSGGQKQRIAIARAILKDPRILLLDEATSALDAESEHIVQEALDRIMTNRTTVIVAHRLSTVRNAESIAVVQKGRIVEQGPHDELVKDSEGAYSQLIRLQEAGRELERRGSASMEIRRQSSQMQRSISRNSSTGNSSRHSFSVPFVVPMGVDVYEKEEENKTQENKDDPPPPSLSRLAAMNKPEIPWLILGSISAAVAGAIMPLFGLMLARIIRAFYKPPQELRNDTRLWALVFVGIGVVSLFAYPGRTYFFAVAGARLINRVRMKTFESVVHMEVAWFDAPENSSGAVGARLSADAATVRGLVGDALGLLAQNVSTLVVALVLAFIANWQLSLIVLALLPLIGLNGYVQLKFMKGFSADAKMMYEEASQVANDAVGSIRTVASFSAEEKMMDMYRTKCEAPMKTGIRQGIVSGIGFGFSFFLLFCAYATIFWVGAKFVDQGKTTFGDVFQVFFALSMAGIGLSQSSGLAPDTSKAKSSSASVFAILDRKSKIDASDLSGLTPDRVKGVVEFKHVSFRYPSRPDVQIFQDLCLTIQAGKTVALVGESGCGKSTAIALLQRFYDPEGGSILLDGEDIRSYQVAWLRRQMGLVGQEPVLFNESIRDNIAYGKDGQATEAEIIAAAEAANAHKFISGLQQGYETTVGERGIQLSGGQKQRVAIARAIVKDPSILLLDEATSALDAESERVVQDALDRVMVNRTTVIVAHRLSTIKGADVIAVVKNGAIIEKGRHEDLIRRKDGAYASLVALYSKAP